VTGEGRSFEMPAVRASLREFLSLVGAVAVDMVIARRASSSLGWTHAHDKTLRASSVRNTSLTLGYHALLREFAQWSPRLRLDDASTCGRHAWFHNASCCHLARQRNRTEPPGAFLQYASFARCARRLLDAVPCLTHVIRTRPDNLFLNASEAAQMSLVSENRPSMIRKGERGLYALQPGDQFIVAPAALARSFFSSFDEPISAACSRGEALAAWDPVPEKSWVGRRNASTRKNAPFVLRSFPVVQVDVLGRPVCNVGLYHWRGGSDVKSRDDCRARTWRTLERLNQTAPTPPESPVVHISDGRAAGSVRIGRQGRRRQNSDPSLQSNHTTAWRGAGE
jgi:hypothetical protein